MIMRSNYVLNGRTFTRTESDAGRYVVRDGVEYAVADDPSEYQRIYEEGREIEEVDATSDDYKTALQILLGVEDGDLQ